MTEKQKSAFEKFNKLKVGALFMKQGTGKTRVALELANNTKCELVLFIVPHSLISNTVNEIKKWRLNKKYLIETYQGISMSDKRYLQLLNKIKNGNTLVIADETIFIKNENSKIFKRMLKIRDLTQYRLILNGTPITKNEWDLFNQMEFLSPLILKMTRQDFLNKFFSTLYVG